MGKYRALRKHYTQEQYSAVSRATAIYTALTYLMKLCPDKKAEIEDLIDRNVGILDEKLWDTQQERDDAWDEMIQRYDDLCKTNHFGTRGYRTMKVNGWLRFLDSFAYDPIVEIVPEQKERNNYRIHRLQFLQNLLAE